VLRGLGACLALPLLDAMRPARARAAESNFKAWERSAKPQPRIIFCYVPNGKNIFAWLPKTQGPKYELSPTLAPLAAHREDFTLVSGLAHPHATGGHSGADTWLTGADLRAVPGADYTNTVSIDQVIAELHGAQTRFPSLQISDFSGTGEPLHSHTLSFDRAGIPLPAETSPRRLFHRLFVPEDFADRAAALQQYGQRRSILDSVLADAKALRTQLGKRDQQKVDEYLGSVRATESRISRLESWVNVPRPKVDPMHLLLDSQPQDVHDRAMWLDVMLELSYLTFITDTSRVITYEWSREAAGVGGSGENHHELSHHGGDKGMLEKLAGVDRFHIGRLARFLGLLKSTHEADDSMLDRTIVVYGSGMNSGVDGEHSPKDLPLLVAGGTKLGLKHGRHIRFDPKNHPPMSNLLLALSHKMGAKTPRFQDSSGPMKELV
jgi:hypothetical protein